MATATPQLLRTARIRAGVTQAELARRAGMPRSVVNAYERGTREPRVGALQALLRALGLTLGLEPVSRVDERRSARELYAALQLADSLPRRPRRTLRYPPLRAAR